MYGKILHDLKIDLFKEDEFSRFQGKYTKTWEEKDFWYSIFKISSTANIGPDEYFYREENEGEQIELYQWVL